MSDLWYILRRITQTELSERMGMTRSNVTTWKVNNAVPKKRQAQLKEIREQLKKEAA